MDKSKLTKKVVAAGALAVMSLSVLATVPASAEAARDNRGVLGSYDYRDRDHHRDHKDKMRKNVDLRGSRDRFKVKFDRNVLGDYDYNKHRFVLGDRDYDKHRRVLGDRDYDKYRDVLGSRYRHVLGDRDFKRDGVLGARQIIVMDKYDKDNCIVLSNRDYGYNHRGLDAIVIKVDPDVFRNLYHRTNSDQNINIFVNTGDNSVQFNTVVGDIRTGDIDVELR
ncbi:MAG: hypothetical protein BWY68_00833 [bacterium ADurb.Bin400]|nr:MAG: hypothetical protein BWY68_00833 [bacterium ADurb.Bin400]